ncbi:hypothetical protein L1987_84541 [Smallanthus sonchifolius]|uniref:Uncharacterized protein n=1 Tax=Smallanthus sonchifolius TaxID=185202 RepID=A0ACB8YGI9_9ASTR|nr:hypothetical protein L1987_84541 [Smallanthus sonchifolius]
MASAEELLTRIQELEVCHAHIKQQISKHHQRCRKLTETQYLNIIQSMSQAIHVFDRKYRIHFWNRAAEEIYGLTAPEIFGKTPTEILVDPKDAVLAHYLLERTASKVKLKMVDKEESPQGHICSSPFGVFSVSQVKHRIISCKAAESEWPWNWKRKEVEDSVVAKLCRFGWQRLYVNQEHQIQKETDSLSLSLGLDYEIIWEDLITKRLIGQGSCGLYTMDCGMDRLVTLVSPVSSIKHTSIRNQGKERLNGWLQKLFVTSKQMKSRPACVWENLFEFSNPMFDLLLALAMFRSDVYSYGVVLWEIITRKIPWDDLNQMQSFLTEKHMQELEEN